MTSQVFVDDILHAFESEGNLHLVLGIVNGNELRTSVATLILPSNRASAFTDCLLEAIKVLLAPVDTTATKIVLEAPKHKAEYLGQGIRLPK